jgi:hypothetical protein
MRGSFGVSLGHRYPVIEETAMPRIHDMLLKSPFFIYPSMQEARAGESVGGTGFLVCKRFEQNAEYGQIYAVTNEHIIAECKNNVVLRLNSENGIQYESTPKKDWRPHPSGIYDVAVLPIDLLDSDFRRYISDQLFLSEKIVEDQDIGPGDDTFMIGRFVGHEGKVQNLVSVRFGNLSALPNEPMQIERQERGKNFLVECRSISGYSGSPVFVWIDPNRPRPPIWASPTLPTYNATRYGPFLLGIDAAHIETQIEVKQSERARKIGTVSFITAMSVVVPAWHLTELLETPELVEQRNREDEEITQKKKAGFIVEDSGR